MTSMPAPRCPVSVLIPVKNESQNLARCLAALRGWADEVVVVDSQSTDGSIDVSRCWGAEVLQFYYEGGWPKKRQWALDTYRWRNDWILLLDADEILSPAIKDEIGRSLSNPAVNGYWLRFQIVFLGRMLRYGDTGLWKLSLFRRGLGRYEMRLRDQDPSMADMEVHEHVVVQGDSAKLASPVRHENVNSLDRYIEKHNAYSNWEAKVITDGQAGHLKSSLFGNQAQRRRWLKKVLLRMPGMPLFVFLYMYFFKLGVLDGRAGFTYAVFRSVQYFHIKAKVYERRLNASQRGSEMRRAA